MALMTRKPLFLQGPAASPVLHPAEDTRLNLASLWTPDGADGVKVRSGAVWGPYAGGGAPLSVFALVANPGQINVRPGRWVIQGTVASSGAYVGTVEATTAATVPSGSWPAAGQYKAGVIAIHVYDTVYGDSQDGWAIEVPVGASASTAAAAVPPAVPNNSLQLGTFTIDSSGNVSITATPKYTAPNGDPFAVMTATERLAIANPYNGMTCWEIGTGRTWTYTTRTNSWQYMGGGQQPRVFLVGSAVPNVPASTDGPWNAWAAPAYDTDGYWDSVGWQVTIPAGLGGMYQVDVNWGVSGTTSMTTPFYFRVVKKARTAQTTPPTNVIVNAATLTGVGNASATWQGAFAAGDVISFQYWTNQASCTGGSNSFGQPSFVSLSMIGGA